MLETTRTMLETTDTNTRITKRESSFSSRKQSAQDAQLAAKLSHRAVIRLRSQLRLDHALESLHILPAECRVVEDGGRRLLC
jgi:hypothetical protein